MPGQSPWKDGGKTGRQGDAYQELPVLPKARFVCTQRPLGLRSKVATDRPRDIPGINGRKMDVEFDLLRFFASIRWTEESDATQSVCIISPGRLGLVYLPDCGRDWR